MKTVLGITLALVFATGPISAVAYDVKHNFEFFNKPVKKIKQLPVSGTKISSYTCKEVPTLRVQYFKIGNTAAAMVPIHSKHILFVNTLAASGEKYVSGSYVWWTKGDKAFLEDLMTGPPHKKLYSECEQQF